MFKYTIKYKDFLGNDQEDTLRFNISESEMYDLAQNNPKFNVDYLRYIMENASTVDIVDVIREIIVLSYGELSEDGKKFRKSNEMGIEFLQSAAFDALFNELVYGDADSNFATEFMIGVFPDKFSDMIKQGTSDLGNVKAIPVKQ